MTFLAILLSLTSLFTRLEPSVLRLDNEKGPICSAVAVKAFDASLLTAGHCVDDETKLFVNGREVVVVRRANRDMALLEFLPVFDESMPELKPVPLAAYRPRPGQQVAAMGYPYGELLVLFTATYASRVAPDGMVWIDGHSIPGMSGGGIFDKDGKLLTIIKGTVRGVQVAEDPMAVRRFVGGF